MIITVTERGTFRRCRKQWDYNSHNRQSLQPLGVPTALNLGSMIHQTLEKWINSPDPAQADGAEIFIGVAAEYKSALEQRYLEAVGMTIQESELEKFYDSVALGHSMMQNYKTQWGSPIPKGFTLIQPEQTIVVPIPGTEHTCEVCASKFPNSIYFKSDPACEACNGTGTTLHKLEATLDFLAQDPNGVFWIGEHKTYGQRPRLEHLEFNDQFLAYTWVVNQLNIGPVGGLLYDGMWKRSDPPRGRDFSELFIRDFLSWGRDELATFEQELRYEAMEMGNPDTPIYRNKPWMGCWDCSFSLLCKSEARNEDSQYVRETFYIERPNTKLWAAVDPEDTTPEPTPETV